MHRKELGNSAPCRLVVGPDLILLSIFSTGSEMRCFMNCIFNKTDQCDAIDCIFICTSIDISHHLSSTRCRMNMKLYKVGAGLLNGLIDLLPFEAHLPGYQYCGPGTKLQKRLARGDPGINKLDAACKVHDIAYSQYSGDKERIEADRRLADEAWKRVYSSDAGIGERTAALAVTAAMKGKIGLTKTGSGLKKRVLRRKAGNKKKKKACTKKKNKKCCTFKKMVAHTKKSLRIARPRTADQIIDTALAAAKSLGSKKIIAKPRIIPIPKSGGVLPLVPIFAGLSALGSLIGGTASVLKAIKSTDDGRNALKNTRAGVVEIAQSKSGEGLYLKPYKSGYGLYLNPYHGTKN